jgi:dienelactone hydrolase
LSKTRCPVLAVFGGKDLQVDATPNRAAVERALAAAGNRQVRVEVFPDANHLYQKAVTGGVDEYARLEKAFVPGFLDLLSSWILAQVPVAARGGV